jgi:nicotinate-nucleotide--dimethylbenzimidazole phosphoribosyltransferase
MKMVLKGLRRLEIEEKEVTPLTHRHGYVSLSVVCCAICRTDAKMWEQGHRDLVFPRVLGHEMVVEDDFGRRFAVWPGKSCGHCRFCRASRENLCEDMEITGFHNDGGFADRVLLPERSLVSIPDDFDPHVACLAEPVGCVVNVFEKLSLEKNDRVIVYGGGTMGLIAALYAMDNGFDPVIIEKSEEKIRVDEPFLKKTSIKCAKKTNESEFAAMINACPDFIAFCNGIAKVGKAGQISFFSGISKNEHIETNLLNLLHYKEIKVSGAYGLTREHLKEAIPFMLRHSESLKLLIEQVVFPRQAPLLMKNVLSSGYLKYILDFRLSEKKDISEKKATLPPPPHKVSVPGSNRNRLESGSLCKHVFLGIDPVTDDLLPAALAKMDEKTKPIRALGRLEDLAIRMCLIQNSLSPRITRKNLFVFAADHGITQEGVSAYPSEVTGQMVENFLSGGAAINVLCHQNDIDLKIVDIGVEKDFADHPWLIRCKVARGTRNFAVEPAMNRRQMFRALECGMRTFLEAYENRRIDIVGLGEMGIGNTTSASAIISVITGITPEQATGRGTGVDDKGLAHKTEVIEKALNYHSVDPDDGFEILCSVGGFEIAGITGAVLAAASKRVAIVLDGLISTAAGLVAYVLNPDVRGYLIAGHQSVEPAQKAALSRMGLSPVIDLGMRLGEGTGAALAIDLARSACNIMTHMATFEEAKISRATLEKLSRTDDENEHEVRPCH